MNKDNFPKTIEIQVVSQFIKDMSFENFRSNQTNFSSDDINYELNITVQIEKEENPRSQVILKLLCEARDKKGTIYILEIEYGGNFEIGSAEKGEKRKILLVECPKLLFPFLRRLAYDITKEGGFFPLNIKPLDFSSVQDAS